MKRNLLVTLFSVFAVSAPAAAQECDLQIREGSAARDLGRALKCIDERLKTLETRQGASDTRPGSGPQRNAPEFDAKSFAVSVRSAARDASRVNVLITVTNKSTEDVYLAANSKDGQVLFDETSGAASHARSVSGIRVDYGGSENEQVYTPIPANTVLSFTISFDADSVRGSNATVTVNLYHYAARKVRRVTAPFNVSVRS